MTEDELHDGAERGPVDRDGARRTCDLITYLHYITLLGVYYTVKVSQAMHTTKNWL